MSKIRYNKSSPTQDFRPQPALIYTGTIISVDPTQYTVRVRGQAFGIRPPIEIPSTFMNVRDGRGAGIHFMPEVGSEVWLAKTSDGTFVIINYHGAVGKDTYKGTRPDLSPGDITFSSSSGNKLSLYKGGTILMESSPVCKLLLEKSTDSTTIFSSNIFIHSLSMNHTCELVDDSDSSQRSVLTTQDYFEFADDTFPVVRTSTGSLDEDCVQDHSVYESGESNTPTITVKKFKSGLIDLYSGDCNIETNNVVISSSDILVTADKVRVKPATFMEVGDSSLSDSVLKSSQLLTDLNAMVSALDTFASTVGTSLSTAFPPIALTIPALVASIKTIQLKIGSNTYLAKKLKSE